MAHLNDLNAARKSSEGIRDPYERTIAQSQVAIASALTDIAVAIEDASYEYQRSIR